MGEAQTKQKFAESLEKVMEEKPIGKIRVTDVIEESGLSRQTFYRHFHDLYDLIDWTHLEKTRLAFELIDVSQDMTHGWVVCLRLMARSKTFYQQVIATTGQNSFQTGYFARCQNNLYRMVGGEESCDESLRFAVRFATAGITHMIQGWIQDGMVQPPEEMAKLFVENMPARYQQAYNARRAKG